jgi:hypothetical protein
MDPEIFKEFAAAFIAERNDRQHRPGDLPQTWVGL